MGRCWGSCTTPRMAPYTLAKAAGAVNSKTANASSFRRVKFLVSPQKVSCARKKCRFSSPRIQPLRESSPGGATELSPALQRWGKWNKRYQVPEVRPSSHAYPLRVVGRSQLCDVCRDCQKVSHKPFG